MAAYNCDEIIELLEKFLSEKKAYYDQIVKDNIGNDQTRYLAAKALTDFKSDVSIEEERIYEEYPELSDLCKKRITETIKKYQLATG